MKMYAHKHMKSIDAMETVFLPDQLPYEQKSFFLLSWFGTFLTSQSRYDWIEHRHLSQDRTANKLLFLRLENELIASSQLLKRHTAPRALPFVTILKLERNQVALRCIKTADSQDIINHLITAIPDGSIEINRTNVNPWEQFLLLSSLQVNNLYNLLYKRHMKNASDGGRRFTIGDGFMLRAGSTVFDLRDLQERQILENFDNINSIIDIDGNEVEINDVEHF